MSSVNANEDKRMFKKYEKIELGMTMEEVEDILGEPEDVYDTHPDEEQDFSTAIDTAMYGYYDADFWYYRDKEYDKNVEAGDNFDLDYDYQPYTQIRIVFDKSGKVIEAYFNTNTDIFSLSDYGGGEDKTMTEIEFLDGEWDSKKASNEEVRIDFEDGSSFLGTLSIKKDATTFKHFWGELKLK